MFWQVQAMMQPLQAMQQLMRDERCKTVLAHPNVQALLQDPEFQALVKAQDLTKIIAHPKCVALMSDPEFVPLLAALNPGARAQDVA